MRKRRIEVSSYSVSVSIDDGYTGVQKSTLKIWHSKSENILLKNAAFFTTFITKKLLVYFTNSLFKKRRQVTHYRAFHTALNHGNYCCYKHY